MPETPNRPLVTAFDWVPEFARGLVRDLRIRWAFEEVGKPYETRLYQVTPPRPDDYLAWQPFGQVPAFDDGQTRLFESGAILLYLAQQEERLLPLKGQARWDAIAWLFAALNSVEPAVLPVAVYDFFHKDKEWAKGARAAAAELANNRLKRLSDALDGKQWLAGEFSIADIVMVHVLQNLRITGLLQAYPNLTAYQQRGEARPAYKRALAAQLADFKNQPQEKGV